MSDGSAVNHVGVWPAANSDAISLETAAELVSASAMREEGSAVWRTWMMETLVENVSDPRAQLGALSR